MALKILSQKSPRPSAAPSSVVVVSAGALVGPFGRSLLMEVLRLTLEMRRRLGYRVIVGDPGQVEL